MAYDNVLKKIGSDVGAEFKSHRIRIENLESDITLKAPIDSAALTGTPTAPTVNHADVSNKIATTEHVEEKLIEIGAYKILKRVKATHFNLNLLKSFY